MHPTCQEYRTDYKPIEIFELLWTSTEPLFPLVSHPSEPFDDRMIDVDETPPPVSFAVEGRMPLPLDGTSDADDL